MTDSSKERIGNYPIVRMRRNRMKKFSRDIVSENFLNVKNLIYPLFVSDENEESSFIKSMPGVRRHSIKSLVKESVCAYNLGIPAIAIFPHIKSQNKDEEGSISWDKNNIVCRSIDSVKQKCPEIGIICDVALDPFTSHGHDGIIKNGIVDNDLTIEDGKLEMKHEGQLDLSGSTLKVSSGSNATTYGLVVSDSGKILPSRITSVSQKKQRKLSLAIKRAQFLGLI